MTDDARTLPARLAELEAAVDGVYERGEMVPIAGAYIIRPSDGSTPCGCAVGAAYLATPPSRLTNSPVDYSPAVAVGDNFRLPMPALCGVADGFDDKPRRAPLPDDEFAEYVLGYATGQRLRRRWLGGDKGKRSVTT